MTHSEITDEARNALLCLARRTGLDRAEQPRIPSTHDNHVSGGSRNPNKRTRGLIHIPSENGPEDTVPCEKMDDAEFTRFKTISRRRYNYDWLRKSIPSAPKGNGISMDTRMVLHPSFSPENAHRVPLLLGYEGNVSHHSANQSFSPENARHVPLLLGYEAETNEDVDSETNNAGNEVSNRGSIFSGTRLRTGDWNIAARVNRASSVSLPNNLDSKSSDDEHRVCKKCQNKMSPPPKKMRIQPSDASSKKTNSVANKDKPPIIDDPLSKNVERRESLCGGSVSGAFLNEKSVGTPKGIESEAEKVHRPEDGMKENKKKSTISASKSKNGSDNGGVRKSHPHRHRAEDESRQGTTKMTILPSRSGTPDRCGDRYVRPILPPSKSKSPRDSDPIASDSHSPDEDARIEQGEGTAKMLVDRVLGRGKASGIDQVLNEQPANRQSTTAAAGILLPVKFRFEDEFEKEAEKTDHEIDEEESWASDVDRFWAETELKPLDYAVAEVDEDAPITETQHDRCLRGLHELTLRDEEGLVCMCCNHVELGPKEVLPQWAAKTRRGSGRKSRYSLEDVPEPEGVLQAGGEGALV